MQYQGLVLHILYSCLGDQCYVLGLGTNTLVEQIKVTCRQFKDMYGI